jgi:GDP-4-dehydro-6-deoxy-D-mannose reductase
MADSRGVLVTGAAGFLGLAVVRSLTRAGYAVVAADRAAPAEFQPRAGTVGDLVRYAQRDVAAETLDDLVDTVDGVVHAAALTPADERAGDTSDELLAVNLGSLLPLLTALRTARRANRLLLVSSAGVFDQADERSVLIEADATGGTSLYGASKLAAEGIAHRYAALHGLEFCAVRPTSLFGAGEAERSSRPRVTSFLRLVEAAASGLPVRLERVDSRLDWLSVDDAADAITALWRSAALDGRSYNLSSGRPRRFGDVADEVAAATGLHFDDRAPTVVDGGADRPAVMLNARLRAAVDWSPQRSFADAARDVLEAAGTYSAGVGRG